MGPNSLMVVYVDPPALNSTLCSLKAAAQNVAVDLAFAKINRDNTQAGRVGFDVHLAEARKNLAYAACICFSVKALYPSRLSVLGQAESWAYDFWFGDPLSLGSPKTEGLWRLMITDSFQTPTESSRESKCGLQERTWKFER